MSNLRPGVIRLVRDGAPDIEEFADRAACRGTGNVLDWFPARGDNAMVAACKAICALCVARDECLEVGLRERDGIWGGTSARERRAILRDRGWRYAHCKRCHVTMLVVRRNQPTYCTDECQEAATHSRKNEWHRNHGGQKQARQIAANERGRG